MTIVLFWTEHQIDNINPLTISTREHLLQWIGSKQTKIKQYRLKLEEEEEPIQETHPRIITILTDEKQIPGDLIDILAQSLTMYVPTKNQSVAFVNWLRKQQLITTPQRLWLLRYIEWSESSIKPLNNL